jgi:hypothetical protein
MYRKAIFFVFYSTFYMWAENLIMEGLHNYKVPAGTV